MPFLYGDPSESGSSNQGLHGVHQHTCVSPTHDPDPGDLDGSSSIEEELQSDEIAMGKTTAELQYAVHADDLGLDSEIGSKEENCPQAAELLLFYQTLKKHGASKGLLDHYERCPCQFVIMEEKNN